MFLDVLGTQTRRPWTPKHLWKCLCLIWFPLHDKEQNTETWTEIKISSALLELDLQTPGRNLCLHVKSRYSCKPQLRTTGGLFQAWLNQCGTPLVPECNFRSLTSSEPLGYLQQEGECAPCYQLTMFTSTIIIWILKRIINNLSFVDWEQWNKMVLLKAKVPLP